MSSTSTSANSNASTSTGTSTSTSTLQTQALATPGSTRRAPPPNLVIRPGQALDAAVLGVLATQVFLDTYATAGIRAVVAREVLAAFSTEALELVLGDPLVDLQLAEVQDHVVGFQHTAFGVAHEIVRALSPTAVPAELVRLYVQEPFTGCGIGKALLQASEAVARQRGADVLWLTPDVHNHRALQFYAAQGYRDLGPTSFQMEHETHENRVYCKAL